MRRGVLPFVVGLAALVVSMPPAAGAKPLKCTVKGGATADRLEGTGHRDVICAGAGNDVVTGGGGADLILGAGGADELHGEGGADSIAGGPGDDVLDGGPGKNVCSPGAAPDTGGACVDYLIIDRLRVSPQRIDTSNGARNVAVEVRLTDTRRDPPGFSQVYLTAERRNGDSWTVGDSLRLHDGTETRGTWGGKIVLAPKSPRGAYGIGFGITDAAGPGFATAFSGAALAAAGFDNTFEQTGDGDAEAPELKGLKIVPDSVDTSGAPAGVSVQARTSDDLTGVTRIDLELAGPAHNVGLEEIVGRFKQVSGTQRDGTWSAPISLPRYASQGEWTIERMQVIDAFFHRDYSAGELKRLGFDATFRQTGPGDETPPVLNDFNVEPTHFNTAENPGQAVQVRGLATDDLAGMTRVDWTLVGVVTQSLWYSPGAPVPQASWDERRYLRGPFQPPLPFGPIPLQVTVRDAAYLGRVYDAEELQALGFPGYLYNGS